MQDFLDTDSPSAGPPKTGLSETIRDFEYFSMLCPGKLRGIQAEVKAVCDRLDYQGSPIYDEYPDRVAMEQLSRRIARRVSERLSEEENTALYTAEVRSYSGTVITGNPAPRVRAMETAVTGEAMETGEEGDTESLHMEAVNGRGGPKGPGPARRPWGPPPPPPNRPWGPPPPPNHPWGPPLPATESSRRARESGLGRHRGASPVFRNSAQKMPKQRMPLNRFVLVRIYEDMV